jgi:hypothetical protein
MILQKNSKSEKDDSNLHNALALSMTEKKLNNYLN